MVLLPDWECPRCRNLCNCSNCRKASCVLGSLQVTSSRALVYRLLLDCWCKDICCYFMNCLLAAWWQDEATLADHVLLHFKCGLVHQIQAIDLAVAAEARTASDWHSGQCLQAHWHSFSVGSAVWRDAGPA